MVGSTKGVWLKSASKNDGEPLRVRPDRRVRPGSVTPHRCPDRAYHLVCIQPLSALSAFAYRKACADAEHAGHRGDAIVDLIRPNESEDVFGPAALRQWGMDKVFS